MDHASIDAGPMKQEPGRRRSRVDTGRSDSRHKIPSGFIQICVWKSVDEECLLRGGAKTGWSGNVYKKSYSLAGSDGFMEGRM